MSGAAPGSSVPTVAAIRLAVFVTAVALVTTRVGLVVHELIGHGGAANAVGAGVDEVRLFWFAGGWIHYSRDDAWTLPAGLIVQLGGIAIELVVGLAAVAWGRRRPTWLGLAVTGAGAGWVIHAGAYLAIGTWHGYGDGVLIHRALGDAKAAVAIPAGVVCVVAAFLAARALTSRLEAAVPVPSRAGRLALVGAAVALAGGINAGLSRAELVIRADSTYGAIMRPERDREIDRELAAWLAAERARGADADAAAIEDRRRAPDRTHRTFPFGVTLIVAIALAAIVGAARSRRREGGSPNPPLDRRVLTAVALAATAALALVVGADAIFPPIMPAMADASVRELLGGGLRPNDPRRFLIEAMIGAMNADGVVDPRERAVLDRHIKAHDLFSGLGAPAAQMLIELANDAIRITGAAARAVAIAKGLPARIHRLAAFGMATEVCAADLQVVTDETHYLESLRIALRISAYEGEQLVHAARIGGLARFLDDRVLRIKNLIPTAASIFALRAQSKAALTDDHRFRVRDFFQAIPDLSLRTDELDVELYRAFRRTELSGGAHVYQALSELARTLPDPVDRYWMIVYALVAEVPATVASWRIIPFVGVLQGAFQVGDHDMDLAVVDALSFPPALPRPG